MEPYREAPAPAEADRSILVVGIDGYLLGVDRTTGEQRWQNPLIVGGDGEVFIALRYGALIVSALDAVVLRIDYLTGATLWERPTREAGRATILVEPDLIIVGKGGYLNAYDHRGKPLWFQELRGRGLGRLSLAFPGNIAQADEAGLD